MTCGCTGSMRLRYTNSEFFFYHFPLPNEATLEFFPSLFLSLQSSNYKNKFAKLTISQHQHCDACSFLRINRISSVSFPPQNLEKMAYLKNSSSDMILKQSQIDYFSCSNACPLELNSVCSSFVPLTIANRPNSDCEFCGSTNGFYTTS